MKKAIILLFIVFLSRSILCDCIPAYYKSISLDTISPGVVKVTRCYYDFWIINHYVQDTCIVDTSFEQKLLDTLRYQYLHSKITAVCHIDTVIPIRDSIWIEDLVHESLSVAIDTVYKGFVSSKLAWFMFRGSCVEGYAPLVNRSFIAFFNGFDSLSQFGIVPSFLNWSTSGYFLESSRITTSLMPGVSVDLQAFLEAMSAGVMNAARNPVNTLPTGYLTFSKLFHLVQQKNLQELQLFTAGGRLVFASGNSQEQMKFLNSLKMYRGIYFVKLKDGKSTITSRLLFGR